MFSQHFAANKNFNIVGGNSRIEFDPAPGIWREALSQQSVLIDEEAKEAFDGAADLDFKMVRDGLADTIVVLDGLFFRGAFEGVAEAERMDTVSGGTFAGYWYQEGRTQGLQMSKLDKLITVQQFSEEIFKTMEKMVEFVLAWKDGEEGLQATLLEGMDNMYRAVYIASGVMGFDVLADQKSVYESNMSKFDMDLETALKTQQKYLGMELVTEIFEVLVDDVLYFVNRSAFNQESGGKKFPKGKILKSINFHEPIWT